MPRTDQQPQKRGPKPGGYNPGAFKRGDDPRRLTTIKYEQGKSLMELARTKTLEAFSVICDVMEDPNAARKERVLAAGIVLDRGWGRAVQAVAVNTEPSGPRGPHSQLGARAEAILEQLEDGAVDGAIEVTDFVEVPVSQGDSSDG